MKTLIIRLVLILQFFSLFYVSNDFRKCIILHFYILEYMGDLLSRAETGSLGSGSSSSGISSNSSSQCARPGPIDNSNLLAPNPYNVLNF